MRWRVEGGREVLTPADGVGVSPPFATLGPGGSHMVRVVRVSKRPVVGEEAYRLLLDELPERERTILVLRFFGNMTQTQIADRVGISQMHVSRLLAQTVAQLRRRMLADE